MGFHHVTVKIKTSDEWKCLFKDISKSELKKNFVKPYKLGKSIYYSGKILPSNDIVEVKINLTEKNHKNELSVVQDESYKEIQEMNRSGGCFIVSAGWGYNDCEINQCGIDVTDSFINCAPGGGTFTSLIADFIKHPWVVRILAGLIFTIVIAYLGLK